MSEQKLFAIEDIRSWSPCYDPIKHLSEGWSGTAIDILKHIAIPPQDKLWVICRESLIDAKTLRLFALWCARQVEHLMTDDRSQNALVVAERFANGDASRDELDAARVAAATAATATTAATAAAIAAMEAAWAAREAAMDAARDAQIKKLIEMLEEL